MILLLAILLIVIFGYIAGIFFENRFRCSYCGNFYFKENWHRRGMLGHPENIVNTCNECHCGNVKNVKNLKKGWAKREGKSDGPLSWTEYTDHDGMVYVRRKLMSRFAVMLHTLMKLNIHSKRAQKF